MQCTKCYKLANNSVKKLSLVLWPHTNAVTKRSVSVIINLHCGDSVWLCSVDFVSGSNVESKKCSGKQEQIHWALYGTSREVHTPSLSVFGYTWVLLSALGNGFVVRFSFYDGRDKLHAPLATVFPEKFVERKCCKRPKKPNINFRSKCFPKEPLATLVS